MIHRREVPIFLVDIKNQESTQPGFQRTVIQFAQVHMHGNIIGCTVYNRSEERRVGKSVDLGGRRIIKKTFFQAEDGIRDISIGDWSSDVCSSDLNLNPIHS